MLSLVSERQELKQLESRLQNVQSWSQRRHFNKQRTVSLNTKEQSLTDRTKGNNSWKSLNNKKVEELNGRYQVKEKRVTLFWVRRKHKFSKELPHGRDAELEVNVLIKSQKTFSCKAMQRMAGDFCCWVNKLNRLLPDDSVKGRIIGRRSQYSYLWEFDRCRCDYWWYTWSGISSGFDPIRRTPVWQWSISKMASDSSSSASKSWLRRTAGKLTNRDSWIRWGGCLWNGAPNLHPDLMKIMDGCNLQFLWSKRFASPIEAANFLYYC